MTNQNFTPETLLTDVRDVLKRAFHGNQAFPTYITEYQILNRLASRDQIIQQEGNMTNEDSSGPIRLVRNAVHLLANNNEVAVDHFDVNGEVTFKVGDKQIMPVAQNIAFYRFIGGGRQQHT